MTSGLAVRERWKRKAESDRRASAELEAQQQAMQAAQATAQAEYWKEQSMRPGPMPKDATRFLELELGRMSAPPVELEIVEPKPSEPPSEPPPEFADEPTDPGIRKRP